MLPPCCCCNPQTLWTEVAYLFFEDIRILALAIIGRNITIATGHERSSRCYYQLWGCQVGMVCNDTFTRSFLVVCWSARKLEVTNEQTNEHPQHGDLVNPCSFLKKGKQIGSLMCVWFMWLPVTYLRLHSVSDRMTVEWWIENNLEAVMASSG